MKFLLSKFKLPFCLYFMFIFFASCDKTNMVSPLGVTCNSSVKLNPPSHNYSQLIITQTYRNNYADTSWQRIYSFDNTNRVKSEEYIDHNFSYANYISEFVYDENNLLTEVIRNDTVYISICWEKDSANYIEPLSELNHQLVFDNNRLIQVNSKLRSDSYNYDFKEDTVSIEINGEQRTDLFDFDTEILNPHHLLKSIGVIQYWNRYPFFKNIHRVEKRYPFQDLDVHYPLRFIGIEYFFDEKNRVSRMERDQLHIYAVHFNYLE